MTVTIGDTPLHPVSDLLFGQMIEHTDAEEPGPEVFYDSATGTLRPDVLACCRELAPSIVRFPGGACVEFERSDWTSLIANAPSGTPQRKRYGYDQFLRMTEESGWQVVLPLNVREALWDPGHWESRVLHACGLVAYANARAGAPLPEGMPDWGALRGRNGRQEPFNVKYIQLGNEWNAHWGAMAKESGLNEPAEQVAHAKRVLLRMCERIRAIDPRVTIITDGVFWDQAHERRLRMLYEDGAIRKATDLLAIHSYRPWSVDRTAVTVNGRPVDPAALPDETMWRALVSVPDMDEQGQSTFTRESSMIGRAFALAKAHGWPVAMTEWNLNAFGFDDHRVLRSIWAKGVGAAGYLHALMRAGDRISLATQSMMLGASWGINSVRVSLGGQGEAYLQPTGALIRFYRDHCGRERLETSVEGQELYVQPVRMGNISDPAPGAFLDVTATRDRSRTFVHLINRRFDKGQPVTVCLKGRSMPGAAILHGVIGELDNHDGPTPGKERCRLESLGIAAAAGADGTPRLDIVLSPCTVTILEIRL